MVGDPNDRRDALELRGALAAAEAELGLPAGAYEDERITAEYMQWYGECNMTKALRWHALVKEGKSESEAYQQVQAEFGP